METADSAAIRGVIETWHTATTRGDVGAVSQLIAEDAVFLTAEAAPMRGRATFIALLEKLLADNAIASRWDVREIVVSGTLAYCWTELLVTVTPKDGTAAKTRRGPTLSLFAKEAGRWVLIRDANLLVADAAELALKVNDLERELMADGPGG